MEKLPRAVYSQEFREQADKIYLESGLSAAEVAKRLTLLKSSLNNWIAATRKGKLASVGKNQKPVSELEMEVTRLKRELAETRMERDFLKMHGVFREGVAVKYRQIETMRLNYPVALMCRALGAAECSFNARKSRVPYKRSVEISGWRRRFWQHTGEHGRATVPSGCTAIWLITGYRHRDTVRGSYARSLDCDANRSGNSR